VQQVSGLISKYKSIKILGQTDYETTTLSYVETTSDIENKDEDFQSRIK